MSDVAKKYIRYVIFEKTRRAYGKCYLLVIVGLVK